VCLCLPFGIRDELAALASAQQLLRDAALLRDHEGGAFSLPDALSGLGLRRINLDVNEADDRHGVLLASSGRSRCGRAASGQAPAALPNSVMKVRRFIRSPRRRAEAVSAGLLVRCRLRSSGSRPARTWSVARSADRPALRRAEPCRRG